MNELVAARPAAVKAEVLAPSGAGHTSRSDRSGDGPGVPLAGFLSFSLVGVRVHQPGPAWVVSPGICQG